MSMPANVSLVFSLNHSGVVNALITCVWSVMSCSRCLMFSFCAIAALVIVVMSGIFYDYQRVGLE